MNNTNYYILFICSEYNDIRINSILTTLSNQIENYPFPSEEKNIKIIVCKDNTELYVKKELLFKEINSPYYEFLDETADVPDTYMMQFDLLMYHAKKIAHLI